MTAAAAATTSPFDRVARTYEQAGRIYSLGLIPRAKAAQMKHLHAGEKVLYLGVGAGEDAALAAQRRVELTCIDLSAGMLAQTKAKLDGVGCSAELIQADALSHNRFNHYDVVCANFFLNMFVERDMIAMLMHAAQLVRPGGRLLVADVAPPQGGVFHRAASQSYLIWGLLAAWASGLAPLHRNYDYRDFLVSTRLSVENVEWFRLFGRGPVVFQNLTLLKAC